MAHAPSTTRMLRFTAGLTRAQKAEFIDLMRSFRIPDNLVPPSVYYLKKLEKYSLKKLQPTWFDMHLTDSEKVCVKSDSFVSMSNLTL